jgi:hypothetical protein
MRATFKIGPGFEGAPRFDEPVLEQDMQNPMNQRRKVIRLGPVRAGEDEEMALPDGEEISNESGKDHDSDRQGPADSG